MAETAHTRQHESGRSQRPVIPGFHPDPSICRVGERYYLVCSSFEYAPGVPVFRSRDLVSWEQVGHVLDRPSQLNVAGAEPSGGICAPTIRHHDGRFWMITTNVSDGGGQLLVCADDAAGPWSEPVRMPSARGIDPDLAWDDDGSCLMTYAGFSADGEMGIVQSAIEPSSGSVLSEPRLIWGGTGGKFPEGPHLYRIENSWYLLIAEGGTERGHTVTVARGTSPSGPFEGYPGNPVLTHRSTDLPVQNTGHADLVERPDGSWAVVYHGVRPRGTSPEWHVLGRETFVDDVVWEGGWPRLTRHVPPITAAGFTDTEQLSESRLGLQWVSPSRWPEEVVTRRDRHWELAAADPDPASGGLAFVGRRQEHLFFRARAELDASAGSGGLSLRIDPRHHFDVELSGGQVRAVSQVGSVRHIVGTVSAPGDTSGVVLQISTDPDPGADHAAGPDTVVLGVLTPTGVHELARLDGRYVSTEVAGGMTGRLVGCYATAGRVGVGSFTYAGSDSPIAGTTP